MAALSVSATPSSPGLVSQQLRTQQAQRAAAQAEANARALRQQARGAQQEAEQAQENARDLKVRSDQAQGEVGAARQLLVALESFGRLESSFASLRENIADALSPPASAAAATTAPVSPTLPTVNAEGQATGTLINVTA